MNRIITFFIVAGICFALTACNNQEVPNNTEESTAEKETELQVPVLVGPWHLDKGKNDISAIEAAWETFPGYAEWGASMEIRSNGFMGWYIGAVGGSGIYSLEGNVLHTALFAEEKDEKVEIPLDLQIVGKDEIKMTYADMEITWAYGDQEDIPTPTATPVPTPTATPVPAPTATLAPAPAPITTSAAVSKINITKNPTGETVDEGGKAIFIARADNAKGITWIIVSPDAKTWYEIDKCPSDFSPLKVQGQGSEKLILTEIPYAINGWRIQCYFTGNGGPAYTSGAILTVNKANDAEAKAKSIAEDYKSVVQNYADYSHWSMGKVENFMFYPEQNYGEHQITLTRGAINLVCTFDTYPADGTCYPVRLDWYENGTADLVEYYTFGSYDGEAWNHFEKRILDITDHYGDGTVGQGMQ